MQPWDLRPPPSSQAFVTDAPLFMFSMTFRHSTWRPIKFRIWEPNWFRRAVSGSSECTAPPAAGRTGALAEIFQELWVPWWTLAGIRKPGVSWRDRTSGHGDIRTRRQRTPSAGHTAVALCRGGGNGGKCFLQTQAHGTNAIIRGRHGGNEC